MWSVRLAGQTTNVECVRLFWEDWNDFLCPFFWQLTKITNILKIIELRRHVYCSSSTFKLNNKVYWMFFFSSLNIQFTTSFMGLIWIDPVFCASVVYHLFALFVTIFTPPVCVLRLVHTFSQLPPKGYCTGKLKNTRKNALNSPFRIGPPRVYPCLQFIPRSGGQLPMPTSIRQRLNR